jgi:hypothetical protein
LPLCPLPPPSAKALRAETAYLTPLEPIFTMGMEPRGCVKLHKARSLILRTRAASRAGSKSLGRASEVGRSMLTGHPLPMLGALA